MQVKVLLLAKDENFDLEGKFIEALIMLPADNPLPK